MRHSFALDVGTLGPLMLTVEASSREDAKQTLGEALQWALDLYQATRPLGHPTAQQAARLLTQT